MGLIHNLINIDCKLKIYKLYLNKVVKKYCQRLVHLGGAAVSPMESPPPIKNLREVMFYQYTESKYFEYAETTLFTMLRQAYIAGWKDSADCAPCTWSKPVHRPRRERRRRHTE